MDVAIPITGAVIVFLAVILIPDFNLRTRVATVLVGVLMIEAGVWKLTSPLFGSEREYTDLRQEVDRFIPLVRSLNKKAVEARAAGTSDLPPRAVPHPMLVPAPVEGREGRASSGTRATA